MQLSSPAFKNKEKIPSKYTCDASNINPELHISHVPPEAKSLVLIMDDPDVPPSVRKDRMWDHWVIFNIPPQTTLIAEDSQPQGIPGRNTEGELNYQGPCPRIGSTVISLSSMLYIASSTSQRERQKNRSKRRCKDMFWPKQN